jgi:hypothetical protein
MGVYSAGQEKQAVPRVKHTMCAISCAHWLERPESRLFVFVGVTRIHCASLGIRPILVDAIKADART